MPYAYGAKIEHEFETDHLNIWLTFRHPMDVDLKPPLSLWLLEVDEIPVSLVNSAWQDEFTLLLTSDTIVTYPERVLLQYDGPNSNLQTTWGKDWEPWGPTLSTDIGKAPGFVDRGDPAVYDWTEATLINDAAWHDLDLSAIVPVGVKAVLLRIYLNATAAKNILYLRTKGNTNDVNFAAASTPLANTSYFSDKTVAPDENLIIQYLLGVGTWTRARITVAGWWF